jgi:hypothetical protein
MDAKERARLHTEILKMVFVTYVRVLKNAPHARILPAVLDVQASAIIYLYTNSFVSFMCCGVFFYQLQCGILLLVLD